MGSITTSVIADFLIDCITDSQLRQFERAGLLDIILAAKDQLRNTVESTDDLAKAISQLDHISGPPAVIHALYFCTVYYIIVPCDYSSILRKTLLPILVSYWKEAVALPSGFLLSANWPRDTWTLISCFAEKDVSDASVDRNCRQLLVSLLKMYFPWKNQEEKVDYEEFRLILFDIRLQENFVDFCLDGLESQDDQTRKFALFFLKQAIKFTSAFPSGQGATSFADEDDPKRLFLWPAGLETAWLHCWTNFFLLYESLREPHKHIIEPLLPLLQTYLSEKPLSEPWLGLVWWQVALMRALDNKSLGVRKLVLNHVVSMNARLFPRLCHAISFIFGKNVLPIHHHRPLS